MGPALFDRQMLRGRQQRARALGLETFLLDRVAEEVGERLGAVLRRFERAVDLGTPNDAVRRALMASGKVGSIVAMGADAQGLDRSFLRVAADEEALPFADGSLDLVVSALTLQFVNDLPGALIQIRRALKPDGLFLAALVGGESLSELRQAFAQAESEVEGGLSPRVAPFADVRELGALLQRAGFSLPVVDSDRLVVRYQSVLALMRDLRRMGATNVLSERRRVPLRRATLERMAEIYAARFADADGRLRASFEIVWLTGWTPHESQQKPLKPGSATRRLADALGTREQSAGEKAGSRAAESRLGEDGGDRTPHHHQLVAQRADGDDDGAGDAGGNDGIFDGGCAVLRMRQASAFGENVEAAHRTVPSHNQGRPWSSVIRWETSGTSAGGIS
jgi:SAM-dependent methyltransferase